MNKAVMVIGIIMVCAGAALVARPDLVRRMVEFWGKGRRLYLAGVLRVVLGVVLVFGASACEQTGAVLAVGIIFIVGGISIFAIGLERARSVLAWWDRRSGLLVRLAPLFAVAVGILLLWGAR